MNPVVKAQLSEFKKNNHIEGFSDADFFEAYSIHVVLNGIFNHGENPFDSHLKGQEFGLDGVTILIDGETCQHIDDVDAALDGKKNAKIEFLFFQSKTSEKFEYGEISKFLDAVTGFFDGSLRGESTQLDDLMLAKDRVYQSALNENPRVKCYFCSTGSYESPIRTEKLIQAEKIKLEDLILFENVSIEMLGAKKLQVAYRAATQSVSAEIEIQKCITLPPHQNVEQSYLGYLPAKELLKLVSLADKETGEEQINSSVFFDNIRDFNPKSPINKKIIEELKDGDKSSFVFKNNGITVVANRIKRTSDKFTLDDFQIVNGCQTSNIVFRCRENLDGVHIPIRIIEASNSEFVSSIIIGTNTQNEVKEEQFWALKPFLKDLEEYCRNQPSERLILIERRENQYRADNIERTRILKPRDLMKAVASMMLYRPHRAARDYRGIRKEFDDVIFREGHNVEPYHCVAIANYRFDWLIRNQRIERNLALYKYYVLYSLGALASDSKGMLSLKKNEQRSVLDIIFNLVFDEEKFIAFIAEKSLLITNMISERGAESREQIRDLIRSDAFASQYSEEAGHTRLDFSKGKT